jgi:hypothetical protein
MQNLNVIVIRSISLAANFAITIFLALQIISRYGIDFFAYYSMLVSIPNVLPFADLGLGARIFNIYVDINDNDLRKNEVSQTFNLSVIGSTCQSFFFSVLGILILPYILPGNIHNPDAKILALAIIIISFTAVPMSLASKKLQAENRNSAVVTIQSFIPLFILSGFFVIQSLFPSKFTLLVLLPSISYLLTNLIIFAISGIHKDIGIQTISMKKHKVFTGNAISFWSVSALTLIAIFWQAPKYYFGVLDDNLMIASYSILLTILLAAFSLVQLPAISLSPVARKKGKNVKNLLVNQLPQTFLLSSVLAIGLIIIYLFGIFNNYLRIEYQLVLFAAAIILFSPIWILPLNTLTFSTQLKSLTFYLIFAITITTVLFFALYTILNGYILAMYLLVFTIGLSLKTWRLHS